jgi:hypothetical protein
MLINYQHNLSTYKLYTEKMRSHKFQRNGFKSFKKYISKLFHRAQKKLMFNSAYPKLVRDAMRLPKSPFEMQQQLKSLRSHNFLIFFTVQSAE